MELALSLEKLVNEKLRNVHSVMHLYFSAFGFVFLLIVFPLELKLFDLTGGRSQ